MHRRRVAIHDLPHERKEVRGVAGQQPAEVVEDLRIEFALQRALRFDHLSLLERCRCSARGAFAYVDELL